MIYLTTFLAVACFAATTLGGVLAGKRICRDLEPFADGPPPATPPLRWMYGFAVMAGLALGLHGIDSMTIAFAALFHGCLVGTWYCDVRCAIIPDWFTIAPIIVLISFTVYEHHLFAVQVAAILYACFALQAWHTKGFGLGWGDAKLAAFGGLLFGLAALLTTMISCIVMVIIAKLTNRLREPVAFAPYLVVGYECCFLIFGGFM